MKHLIGIKSIINNTFLFNYNLFPSYQFPTLVDILNMSLTS